MSLRWLYLLAAVALLHVIVISWLTGVISMPPHEPADSQAPIVAMIEMQKPARIATDAPTHPKPKRKIKSHRATSLPLAKAPATMPASQALSPTVATVEPEAAVTDIANMSASPEVASPSGAAPDQASGASYKISLPPSAVLKYDVQKTSKESQPMYGRGSIDWKTDGSRYIVNGDAGVLFFTVLNFKSEGTIDEAGIAPEIYSEKRFRKSETATHFHRERNTISFSSSTKSYPRTGSEQDRASVIWQLAGIGRGDNAQFNAGAEIPIVVAGTRDAEIWRMQIVGQEEITIDGETTNAWHITRIPRSGSHDQKLDIWLGPQQNWYPVRLRYTETGGDYLDMSLTSLNVSPAP